MKTLIITMLLLTCFAFKSNSQSLDCKKFKTGKFIYPEIPNVVSLRKESTQESYNNGKLVMVWKVKWINECKYELICDQVLVDSYPMKKGDRIVATIVETKGDCFTVSLIFYDVNNPEGETIPGGQMCFEKD